jgi:1-acyl-sn-glycerol-3-phosphate acyltransferase
VASPPRPAPITATFSFSTDEVVISFLGVGSFSYTFNRALAKGIFKYLGPIKLLHPERAERPGAFILAANHISHFDPPVLSVAIRRHIDWMAMLELFQNRWADRFFRSVNAFPTDRNKVDRTAVRTALKRLAAGHVVGIFPEGGIRDGARSILEGAPIRPGAASLAQIAGVPIIPCVVLGTDRLYAKRFWKPFRRATFWIGFGNPLTTDENLDKPVARERLEQVLAESIRAVYQEMQQAFCLTSDDLPHSPQARQEASR